VAREVLIVDDDPVICKELGKELRHNFFSTHIAHTAKDALAMLKEQKISVILLDIRMPDIDGLELLKQAKEIQANCEVIMITGHGSQEVAIAALRDGAIDYLEKPIKLEELEAALGRALEKLDERENLSYQSSVLIVDDDRELTQRLEKFLKKEGFEVFTAHDGEEGLETIRSKKIDVILTDIKMPGISGIELLERAKKLHRDTEVIIMTGHGDEEKAVLALRQGASNYLRKPIDLEELLIAIEKAIEKIMLYRNQLYRHREQKITTEIFAKMNEELERRIHEKTSELAQTQTQLFQTSKLATLGEMSAGLAHELNQPLTGISLAVTNVEKLANKGILNEKEVREVMGDIGGNARRMSRIITHIRTFARQDTFKFSRMNVNESIENALKLLDEQLRLHDIKVTRDLASDLPPIIGESYQIEQVAINLITNVRDALDAKGEWETERRKGWSKELKIRTSHDEDWVYMEISDNGIGMPAGTCQKMFDPFFTTKEVGKATGLGLSISYGIIENHKGNIRAESEDGRGTKITVQFPIIAESQDET